MKKWFQAWLRKRHDRRDTHRYECVRMLAVAGSKRRVLTAAGLVVDMEKHELLGVCRCGKAEVRWALIGQWGPITVVEVCEEFDRP